MTYSIYIDHPDDLGSYTFLPADKTGSDVVSRKLGIKVNFVCNSFARLSRGDVYEVPFENEMDATAFVLRGEYIILDKTRIEAYKKKKDPTGSLFY